MITLIIEGTYLSALHIAEETQIIGKDGKPVKMTVDGNDMMLLPGSYTGQITISLG